MQVARCTQLSQCRIRQTQPAALLARQSPALCSSTFARHAFQPATIVPLRSQRAAVVVRAADVQAAPIDVSSTVESEPQGARQGVAHLRFERGSVSKVRRILDVLRGRSYEEALNICEYMPYKACESITRVLVSVLVPDFDCPSQGLQLTDFGCSCFIDDADVLQPDPLTPSGTALFQPPEQLHSAQICTRSDVYSWGLMVLETTFSYRYFEIAPEMDSEMLGAEGMLGSMPVARGGPEERVLDMVVASVDLSQWLGFIDCPSSRWAPVWGLLKECFKADVDGRPHMAKAAARLKEAGKRVGMFQEARRKQQAGLLNGGAQPQGQEAAAAGGSGDGDTADASSTGQL